MTVAGFIKGRVGSILAGGIRSARHPFILEQASRELHHVCCFKPEIRAIIYQEIYNDEAEAVAGSRLLCEAVKERMEGFEKELDGQIAVLKRIEEGMRSQVLVDRHSACLQRIWIGADLSAATQNQKGRGNSFSLAKQGSSLRV